MELAAGLMAIVLQEKRYKTVKGRDHLAQLLPLPVLGVIPERAFKNRLLATNYPGMAAHLPAAEAFGQLWHTLRLIAGPKLPKQLQITSTDASEGKSSTAVNLAITAARAGHNVLVVDADLRRPTLHKHFGLDNTHGLCSFLAGLGDLKRAIHPIQQLSGLSVMPAGPMTPHPVELLSGGHLQSLSDSAFDLIVLDSPPVLGMADALLLSRQADATVLVAASRQTRISPLQGVLHQLQMAQARVLGTVLTKAAD